MEKFAKFIENVDGFVWGWPLIILILAVGVLLTVRTGFIQVFHLGKALRFMVKNEEDGEGEVTSFGALCTALSATVGTGNIVGVATAICVGGPGALFWMLLAAFFGMATKYSEGLLAILYRTDDGEGHYLGGPFLYIEKGMGPKWKWLGKLFAVFGMMAGLLGIGTMTQINGITSAFNTVIKSPVVFSVSDMDITVTTIVVGLIVTIATALVVIGGIKRISAVAEKIVPFMCVLYVLLAVSIVLINIKAIPAAIALVFKGAFTYQAGVGGFAGAAIKLAMQKGIGRGILGNVFGVGGLIAHRNAKRNKKSYRAISFSLAICLFLFLGGSGFIYYMRLDMKGLNVPYYYNYHIQFNSIYNDTFDQEYLTQEFREKLVSQLRTSSSITDAVFAGTVFLYCSSSKLACSMTCLA